MKQIVKDPSNQLTVDELVRRLENGSAPSIIVQVYHKRNRISVLTPYPDRKGSVGFMNSFGVYNCVSDTIREALEKALSPSSPEEKSSVIHFDSWQEFATECVRQGW